MSWLHFLLWIAGIYILYYLANILYDVNLSGRRSLADTAIDELTFTESHQPVQLPHPIPEDAPADSVTGPAKSEALPKVKQEAEIVASGGVILKNLFSLARTESIVYTKAVSY